MPEMLVLKIGNGEYWIDRETFKELKKFQKRLDAKWTIYMTGEGMSKSIKRRKNRDRRKLAYVSIGNTIKTAWIDTETFKAYKVEGMYLKTWMVWKEYKFIKWLSSFDV